MNNIYIKKTKFVPITVICFFMFFLGFIMPNTATFFGIILSFILTMRARFDGLLGIFILYLNKYYFFSIIPDHLRSKLMFLSIPIDVQTLMCGFIALRVIIEIIQHPKTFKNKIPNFILILWITAFIPVIIGFYLGFLDRSPNWTRGLRWMMLSGSYFYGYILLKDIPKLTQISDYKMILRTFFPFTFIMLFLMILKIYWSHHGFFFLGLGASFSVYYLRSNSFKDKIIGFFLFLMVTIYGTSETFTTMGIVLLALFFSFFGSVKKLLFNYSKQKRIKFYGITFILSIFIFIALVINKANNPNFIFKLNSAGNENVINRLENKIFSDRLVFWYFAFEQIKSGPYFIVPGGRSIDFSGIPGLPQNWVEGAHNVILESLRINGVYSGSVILLIYFIALKNLLNILSGSSSRILRTLSAAILATGITGITTGDFPADLTVAFWIWSVAGLSHGLFLREIKYFSQKKQTSILLS